MVKKTAMLSLLALVSLMSLTGISTFAYNNPSITPNPTTSGYQSLFTLQFSWTGCNGAHYPASSGSNYDAFVVLIPAPSPTITYTRESWYFQPTTSEGVFGLCTNVPFTDITGSIFDAQQLQVGYLFSGGQYSAKATSTDPIIGWSIHYGDTVSFSFQVRYGVWFISKSYTCYNVGSFYGSCTQ